MTNRSRLLLLDANVVIEMFRQGIWDKAIERCDVHLARTVAEVEAHFYEDEHEERVDFDLGPYADDGRITVFDVTPSELAAFCSEFDPLYLDSLDAGEAESLAHLVTRAESYLISSADKIVYRVLGNLNRAEQGISLQEILQQIGLGRPLPHAFSKGYREYWTGRGSQERIQGLGWRVKRTS